MKEDLQNTPMLAFYDPVKETKVSADASSFGFGAVVMQKYSEVWKAVVYASRSLSSVEQRNA